MEEQKELITGELCNTVPPDEIIKMTCLQMAVDNNSGDIIGMAKNMYLWIKEKS